MKPHYLLLLALVVSGLTSCNDQLEDLSQIDETRFSAEYALPLIDSEVKLKDLIGDVTDNVSLAVDPDGLLRFRYSGEVPAVAGDIIFARLNALGQGILLPITQRRQAAPFAGADDVDIDEVHIKSGLLNYSLPNRYDRPVTVTLSIPDATLGGESFVVSGQLPAYSGTGTPPALSNPDVAVDLDGYELNLPNDSLYFEYSIRDEMGNELDPVNGTVVTIINLAFSYMEGYLGQELYPGGRDTIAVNFFDRYLEGEVYFADPTITITMINSFGLPAKALVDVLSVIDLDGNVLPITGQGIDDGFDFEYPRVPGEEATTVFVFDTSNSNLDEILSARPVALDYEINAFVNPDANTDILGFLTDSSAYQAKVDVELPLIGNADRFTVRDTVPLNIVDQYENVTEVTFRLTTKNGLPIDLEAEGTFLDENDNALADLTNGELTLLQAGAVDENGEALEQITLTQDIVLAGERLDAIRSANRLVLTFRISTAGGGTDFVRVTDEQELVVRLGAKIKVE